MPTPILMPALSPTMESGKLSAWLVKEGDTVSSGDVMCEIETDKATMEVECVDEGTIGKILVEAGTEDVLVNAAIAILLEEGEDASALEGYTPPAIPGAPVAAAPVATALVDDVASKQVAVAAAPASAPAVSAPKAASKSAHFSSPLARRIAGLEGIDIGLVTGTGPNGRIIKRDVLDAVKNGVAKPQAVAGFSSTAVDAVAVKALYAEDSYEEIAADGMRKVIAKRMTETARDVPHIFLTIDCAIDALLSARKGLNASGEVKISVNDFVIKAAAMALIKVPEANASWTGDSILMHKHADISMAVAIEGGLITPIVTNADLKGLAELSLNTKDLATRARDRKLSPSEYQGGTFSISNMGMMGIKQFTSIINSPQGAILSVGSGEKRVIVAAGGDFVAKTMMTVTLACDHRVIDGSVGASFLAAFKGFIEQPVSMLL
ncbi:MAG: pyruvate dehydrogenase complex dihydrolipoamide acetyltransferase [Rhizobiales bacterium]|nr:pyruvate dehydrogenase complex dihydrolipoamide acetyltransferase [Hyphomicrobiales bacterium]NRB15551.1 pyruvate dehydrogenase complex dihydrolipoamide acetyltransferase [Hyphomicrobiales bacterium]